ncbi:penicillin-binding protein 1C [Sulfitobacter sp. M57]|uniref:penicillin-binding protein 1C n=1 Tax=unclassified Sulfitobacter TaxID=196795 RepID=UPI0023E2D29C|nr:MULTISPECIES: penicillin-binding protein 1C [unclassified Sulfitobacter]MDF3415258.1 penicillin-binding protein 1C [Sulfitobacter sp. KE5]MDF3422739.1 penicillin-binding protein 1C [Sulfitobacter sp. KE43]MDF3433804.1 penicillin-binding protein 1C [Sulfitobacter sp. KE42]MDF3459444.1 penicillin-binding protein 1C [Sulfitobacter sp. S74]MDF3463343.1 penicillin-binding protein 1C [Sulfitobacter sp. Ks18]
MIRRFVPFALVLTLWATAALRDGFDRWIDATVVPPVLVETSVEMRDRNGALLRVFPVEDGRVRLALRLDQVDPAYLSVLIAYEDQRFYDHRGVDLLALLRATGQAMMSGRVVSGGSTLTMQVARLVENSGTGRWAGKLRQIRLALALERQLNKDDILTLYLAHAPFGGAMEGLRAGSLAWFGKEPQRLTSAEAALLVALPQAPEARRPDRHPQAAKTARARVLARVAAPEQVRMAAVPHKMRSLVRLAPHLTDHLFAQNSVALRHDLTVDARLQTQMETLARRAVRGQDAGVTAAIVVADHRSGEVLASVGSPTYAGTGATLGFVDMTRALRSPGSTLKPFIYAMAFDQGLAHPDTLIRDAPVAFGRYAPQNFDGQFRGDVTVREALQLSLNIPPVLLMQELGPARLMSMMRKGGAKPQLAGKAGLALALGGVGITLNDLVQLYGGLAQGGVVNPLVWERGQEAVPRRIFSRSAAWQVSHILASIAPPKGAADARNIAYKTGTSYGHRDAWAVGFDGAHVIGVWLGRPDGTPVPGAFGGALAAPVLFEAFGRLSAAPAPLSAPPPETLILGTAALPAPLQRFRPRDAMFRKPARAPEVRFPPEGAVLRATGGNVPLKLAAGVFPLTVLVNGVPVLTDLNRRQIDLPPLNTGFSRISVIDATGQSASVQIRMQ